MLSGDRRIVDVVRDSLSIHSAVDAFLESRKVVLMPGILDMSLELCLSANQVHSLAKKIPRRSHRLVIRIRLKKHPA